MAVASLTLTRSSDFDSTTDVHTGASIHIKQGSTHGGDTHVLTTTGDITIGTTAMSFTKSHTDVTLASVGSNYLSLSSQEITAGTVPVLLGGTGSTS